MKKLSLLILSLFIAFTLVGCRDGSTTEVDCSDDPSQKKCEVIEDLDCEKTPNDPLCIEEDNYEYRVSDSSLTLDQFGIEPMRTEVKLIDDVNVLFQYDQVVPTFDNWDGNNKERKHISLNGTWKFTFDEENKGVENKWYDPRFDDSSWDDRQVPSSWDLYDNEYFATSDTSHFGDTNAFKDGYAWYRTSFDLEEEDLSKTATINFLSVSYRSWIYVNGVYVEAHDTGEDAFAFDISEHLKIGKNHISVRVYRAPSAYEYFLETDDNEWRTYVDIQQMPSGGQDWWPYAGITRDVYIELTDTMFISKVLTNTVDDNLHMYAIVTNNSDSSRTAVMNFYPKGQSEGSSVMYTAPANSVVVVHKYFDVAGFDKWDLDTPVLYDSLVEIEESGKVIDSLTTTYGIRTFEIVGNDIYLNGKRIWLKGTCWHEETSDSGRSMRPDEYDFEFDMIEDLGFNFIRNSVYNRHPYAYEVSNERGILVLDEAQNMWMGNSAIDYQYQTYRLHYALQSKTVWNQMNHPSVIMWGLMNETSTSSSNFYNYTKELVEVTKQLDLEDRPTLGAFRSGSYNVKAQELMDIIGLNEYFGFLHGHEDDLGPWLDQVIATHPNKPILITENGAWSTLADRNRQQWHAALFKHHYDEVTDRCDDVIGYTFWVLKDYKSRKSYSSNNNGVSGMGVVPFDHTREKIERMEELGMTSFAYKLIYQQIKKSDNPMDDEDWK